MLELVIISTLNGVLYGMLLFLMASGLTLIFSMMGVLNFAHASFYMLGAFFGFQISRYVGFWPALAVAPLLVGAIGALVERYGLRNVHRHGHVAELLITFGLAFVIEEVVQMIWGKVPVDYRVPPSLDFSAFTIFTTTYPAYKMFELLTAIAIFAVLLAVLIVLVQTFAVSVNYSASDLFAGIGFSPASGTILHDLWEVTLAQIAPIIPYLLLVLILIFRPTGLLGKRET